MAKYNYIKLGVKKAGDLEGLEKLSQTQLNGLRYGNAIYIYRGSKSKKLVWEIFFVVLLVAAFNLVCCLNIVLEGITNKPTIVTLLW
ncbi:hypothetical protein LFLT20_21210 [Limosilactobacillus fermentum]|uniref:hypothetical protein n=1 Tax=Limosilactobacillus fermentum TaxID=1613 RepID=UPI000E0AAB34|nr:hypothetical protein [Limosilactobacillus fermentum]AXH07859.1 hypothetical protein BGV76_07315 [Limosilactobacillus fermentum]MCT3446972.1 hypothetical protein [Limosilactobacillus fermentum]MCT3447434.1 hypothetical protein [Limosilactobacillus fermentum]GIC75117.1 hypothetical protein LFLT20_21210 [Limosilactobacillus fermentum]